MDALRSAGGGAWNMLAQRPGVFAAAAICRGSESFDDVSGIRTPVWNFHGDADTTVSPSISRARIAAMRKAGAHPLSTEYAGVGHNAWAWAYTEPSLIGWMYFEAARRLRFVVRKVAAERSGEASGVVSLRFFHAASRARHNDALAMARMVSGDAFGGSPRIVAAQFIPPIRRGARPAQEAE